MTYAVGKLGAVAHGRAKFGSLESDVSMIASTLALSTLRRELSFSALVHMAL